MFRVGQKVVCVDDNDQDHRPGETSVVKGQEYTVREYYDFFGSPAIRLAEILNPRDRGYHARRFRPIVERKTDISFAHDILRKVSKKQEISV